MRSKLRTSAIDGEFDAGDVRRIVRSQKSDCHRNLLGFAEAFRRDLLKADAITRPRQAHTEITSGEPADEGPATDHDGDGRTIIGVTAAHISRGSEGPRGSK